MKQKFMKTGIGLCLFSLMLGGCAGQTTTTDETAGGNGSGINNTVLSDSVDSTAGDTKSESLLSYEVEPESFALTIMDGNTPVTVSYGTEKRKIANFTQDTAQTTWSYPEENIEVAVSSMDGYLQVSISSTATEDAEFTWPQVEGDVFYLPFGEGKRVPAHDTVWSNYLSGQELDVLEQLSMPFWAAIREDKAVLTILENPYRTSLNFGEEEEISFSVRHSYPQIDQDKTNVFRIYLTEATPTAVAKQYKEYAVEQGRFVPLSEKAKANPNIEKLYGAPHIYFAGDYLVSPDDISWPAFRKAADSAVMDYLLSFADQVDAGSEIAEAVENIKTQDYVDLYQKNLICGYLSSVLKRNDFYHKEILTKQNEEIKRLLSAESLNGSSLIELNKQLLSCNLEGVFQEVSTWMNTQTVDVMESMREAGIEAAWIGLHDWGQALAKPQLVSAAADQGYLIATYDSYHSIHEPGKERWSTAAFTDQTLYEKATVTNQNGEKAGGFQNVGRKLNPTLALPSVRERLDELLSNPLDFNSWFIDCDATGEIHDDYSPEHITTMQQDLAARLERMSVIRDDYQMVIGSEGGHDFAASVIAFAHGIELRTFSWMDEDMKANKDSEYYIGKYYSPSGGVPEHFGKRIPVKENLYTLFVDPRFDLPLYKLVYNDSVITSYHWDWSTFKIKGATKERMLREVLYNVPPLYHLDGSTWEEYREDIVAHTSVWSQFSKKVISMEMTGYEDLSDDGSLQKTVYGDRITVVANFADQPADYEGQTIPGESALIIEGEESTIYTPSVSEAHE